MAELPLDEAVQRFQANEERINKFFNAPDGEESFETSGGQIVPVLPKMIEAVSAKADQAGAAATRAEAARDGSMLSKGIWPTTAAGIGQGVASSSSLVAGSGGTNGTFDLAFNGGTQVLAPNGRFVVEGGAVTKVIIDYPGYYSAGAPTISFAASAGLTGASVAAVMGPNTPVGSYFSIVGPAPDDLLTTYRVAAGPVAVDPKTLKSNTVLAPPGVSMSLSQDGEHLVVNIGD